MRINEKVLTHGELKWLVNDQPESVVSYVRAKDGEQILTVINLTNHHFKVKINGISGNPLNILLSDKINDNLKKGFEIGGYGFLVAKI